MSAALDYNAMVASLVQQGVPRHKAEQEARRVTGIAERASDVESRGVVALPFLMTVPWSELVSDNDKNAARIVHTPSGPAARVVFTARYKAGKEKIVKRARGIVGESAPLTVPLVFVGHVYRPSQHRNDATNFAKLVQDALSGVVYDDDTRLYRVTWIKVAEPDVDAPRAEIEIRAL